MAKKKNENIVITDKELTPTIIGKLDIKQKSPVLLIFLFIIFIAVAIFLPDITNYVNSLLNGEKLNKTNITNNNLEKKEDTETLEEEITYYDYASDLEITYEAFTMSNILLSENKIYFDLNNNTNKEINLEDNKYFLEIYSSDTTLIQRIKISYGVLAEHSMNSYNYDLDENVSNNIAKLVITTKTENDYPEVNLNKSEDGSSILACKKGYEEITYTFVNSYLVSINSIINYPFSNTGEYITNLNNYQVMAATYNNYEGVSATLVQLDTGFTYTALIDLRVADITLLENNNYYKYKTEAKSVKFETESNGFICS